ncbi:hypothetical protein KP509_08G049800 [Ceratopteris richardii]|uniref:Uncharacterized protein n=1 Tax=Ceratopteris richardii TaxID=49495 RepID=A0A8T2U9U4_CERRI|nr:hypothetical protein KP509_08G049800 [Ceratopteris richardii]
MSALIYEVDTTKSDKNLTVKFLVSMERQKILYMEAGKNVVDILLGLLQLPIVSLLGLPPFCFPRATDLTNLFSSFAGMSPSCLLVDKYQLLSPPCPPSLKSLKNLPSSLRSQSAQCNAGYNDSSFHRFGQNKESSGFVQNNLMFIVSDDLRITPSSSIESLMLLKKHDVKSLSDVDSVEANVSSDQASITYLYCYRIVLRL